MNASLFTRGLLIGFSIAAPVGPIGVLCIRRTLAHGRLAGLLSGLGAATADAIYGAIAAYIDPNFCYPDWSSWVVSSHRRAVSDLSGGANLPHPASNRRRSDRQPDSQPWAMGYLPFNIFLTLTNPATIMSFAAVFAGRGLANSGGGPLAASITVLGVFLGSALWWLLLSSGISLFQASFSKTNGLRWVNRGSGIVLIAFGGVALASLLRG